MADNLMYSGTSSNKFDIPISHLDFGYISKCNDKNELEKILKVLRSGAEGHYPDLERECELKLTQIDPESKVLRKDKLPAGPADMEQGEWDSIQNNLKDWTSEMRGKEESLRGQDSKVASSVPPVRGCGIKIQDKVHVSDDQSPAEVKSKRPVKPREYSEWDKFDVDKELETLEEQELRKAKEIATKATLKDSLQTNLLTNIDVSDLSDEEKTFQANREKDKGNEAFRVNDFAEAVAYYTRSIMYVALPASYNNRALAYVKLSKWYEAIRDCNTVLSEEPDNVKAILRRGTSYKGLKEFKKGERDFERVLQLESNNKRAKDLLAELGKERTKEEAGKKERKEKGRRMMIEEVEGSDSEDAGTGNSGKTDGAVQNDATETGGIVNGHDSGMNEVTENGYANDGNQARTETPSPENIGPADNSGTAEGETEKVVRAEVAEEKETEGTGESVAKADAKSGDFTHTSSRPVLMQYPLPADVAEKKESGNICFRSGQYGDAITHYTTAIEKLEKGGTEQTVNLSLLYSNRAACQLKIGDCSTAITDSTQAMTLVPHSIKPLLRRAQAYETTERYRQAYVDFKHVLSIDNSYDLAFQGSTRCAKMLQEIDGTRWRDKLADIPKVSSFSIPLIQSAACSSMAPPVASSNQNMSTVPGSPDAPRASSKSNLKKEPSVTNSSSKKTELTPEEKFDSKKTEGNQFVQKSAFRKAEQCYSECIQLFPKRVVAYTNRALCFLRLNQPKQAEEDCSMALKLESQNVKAMFRRAQARKMLELYKESLTDLTQLLKLDSKNSAAKKEMDLVKKYYREELEKLKDSKSSLDHPSTTLPKSKSEPSSSKTGKKSHSSSKGKAEKKHRKRVVIEEVKGDEQTGPGISDITKKNDEGSSRLQEPSKSQTTAENKSANSNSKNDPNLNSASEAPQPSTSSSKRETTSTDSSGSSSTAKSRRIPKLVKVTPYEFMQAWNSLKTVKETEPYARLLEQVPPDDLTSVISNKLDADMMSKVIKCTSEYFVPEGEADLAYKFLANLCKLPRFQTISMFLSSADKEVLSSVVETIAERSSQVYTNEDLVTLRKNYGIKS